MAKAKQISRTAGPLPLLTADQRGVVTRNSFRRRSRT